MVAADAGAETAVRLGLVPDVVVGDVYGNPMNIALVIGVFAELSRELGVPMRFPGTDKA